jgi:hypothetical protein
MRCVIALLFALAAVSAQGAEIFKCKNKDGSTSFSDRPCPSDATVLSVPKSAQKDAPVNWLCDSETARQDPVGDTTALPERQRAALSSVMGAVGSSGDTKLFAERGNVHVCVRQIGAPQGTPVLSESVVTIEGQTWQRANGKTKRVGEGEESIGGAGCRSRVTACIGPDDAKMEACIGQIATCGIGASGGCCPNDCLGSFRTSRAQNVPIADAVQRMVTLPVCAGAQ